MTQELEAVLKDYFNKALDVAKRECLLNLPVEVEAYVAIYAVDKEKLFREAMLKQLKGDPMNYTAVFQELVADIRFNHEASFERKQALLKIQEAHMWLKAASNKGEPGELDLTLTLATPGGGTDV